MNENINNEVEQNIETTSNTNQIFDLIQSIQSKLNNENNINEKDMNIIQETKDDSKDNTITSKENNVVDFSSIFKNIDLGNLLNNFNNNNNNQINDSNVNNFSFGGIDPSLIMKFGSMFSSVNQSNPKRNLLLSLKPFLRKTRQDKLNEYITILTIVDAIGIFNSKGSDK